MKVSTFSLVFISLYVIAQGTPSKPKWPVQFDVPFGLYIPKNGTDEGVTNATAHFYYNYNIQASTIDYPTNCINLGYPV